MIRLQGATRVQIGTLDPLDAGVFPREEAPEAISDSLLAALDAGALTIARRIS